MVNFMLNGEVVGADSDAATPLLWVLREELKLRGTKFGCGIGSCGACTIHLNGSAKQSCNLAVSSLENSDKITTIEGISDDASHPVQVAWKENDVAQCGYCQSGQILTAVALLSRDKNPSDEKINRSMNVLCRCGTYPRIKKAIKKAVNLMET